MRAHWRNDTKLDGTEFADIPFFKKRHSTIGVVFKGESMKLKFFYLSAVTVLLAACGNGGGGSGPSDGTASAEGRCVRPPSGFGEDYCRGVLDEGRHHDCDRASREEMYYRYCGGGGGGGHRHK